MQTITKCDKTLSQNTSAFLLQNATKCISKCLRSFITKGNSSEAATPVFKTSSVL